MPGRPSDATGFRHLSDETRDEAAADIPRWQRGLVRFLAICLTLGSVAFAADLYRLAGLSLYTEQFAAAMLATALCLAFVHLPARRGAGPRPLPWYDALAAVAALGAGWYLAVRYPALVDWIMLRPPDAVTVGSLLILLVLEAMRRAVGNTLVVIVIVFILYALLGDHVPGMLAGRASDWAKLSGYLAIDVNGMLGIPIMVATTIVVAFLLFGHLLATTGGSGFFTDLALALMGRFRGGSAKIAVVGSALFGSISGSAVANVVSTGVITIPMMKRGGYPAHKAGAIEAVASTGGQLMPPVMGASAFLMAEFLQIPYAEVVLAALVPALLYYAALFILADLEAARAGITRVEDGDIPRARDVLGAGWYFPLPFAVLVVALFRLNQQPATAALWSVLVLLACALAFGYRGARPGPAALLDAVARTGLAVLDIILITAAAGLIIGVLAISGLGFNLTLALVQVGAGNLPLLLLLAAGVCIVLGMGLPTVGVYVLLAALVAPALIEVGVEPIAAHLYVMYFGMMSMLTPPVAIAAFAAAGVAEAEPMRTGFAATRFAWSAYVVPVLFVASPSLLLIGGAVEVTLAVATAVVGVWLVSVGVVGFLVRPLGPLPRTGFAAVGLAALVPSGAFPGALYLELAATAIGLLMIAGEIAAGRRAAALSGAGR